MRKIVPLRSKAFGLATLLSIFLLLIASPSLAKTVTQEAKYNQGEGQLDLVTLYVDIHNLKGKMLFLNSEFSNIPDPVVIKASDLPHNKHGIDLSKYQHLEFELSLFLNSGTDTLSFVSPALKLNDVTYSFVFIGKTKGNRLSGTLYEYMVGLTGEKFLTEIQVK
jgi:hypothetical protein